MHQSAEGGLGRLRRSPAADPVWAESTSDVGIDPADRAVCVLVAVEVLVLDRAEALGGEMVRGHRVYVSRAPAAPQSLWRRSSVRPITIRWISEVPSPISSSGASRYRRSISYSCE